MLSVVVQAGGESRRMGQDKGLILFQGEPLVARVLRQVSSIADEVWVTTNCPQDYRFLGVPLVPDEMPGRGALGGVYTALRVARRPLVAVIACDMPFASAELLIHQRDLLLVTASDAVVPRTPEGLEPFHAVYRCETCLPPVETALQAGQWRADAWFSAVKVYYLTPEEARHHDPRGLAFLNINTPEDLHRAERKAQEIEI